MNQSNNTIDVSISGAYTAIQEGQSINLMAELEMLGLNDPIKKVDPAPIALTAEQIKLDAQVNILASQTGVNITDHRRKQLLACGNINQLNKLFFEKLDIWRKEVPCLSEEEKKLAIFDIKMRLQDSPEYKYLLADESAYFRDFEDINQSLNNKIVALTDIRQKIRMLEQNTPDNVLKITEQIDQILAAGFFSFNMSETLKQARGGYVFNTNNVLLSYKNASAGIDINAISFGRFKVVVNILTGSVKVNKLAKNIDCGGYFHPHINHNGTVCWGNAAKLYESATKSFNIHSILNILQVILTNYNDQSPYKPIQNFHRVLSPESYKIEYRYQGVTTLYKTDYTYRVADLAFNGIERIQLESTDDNDSEEHSPDDYSDLAELIQASYASSVSFESCVDYCEVQYYRQYSGMECISTANYYKMKDGSYMTARNLKEYGVQNENINL